MIAWQRRPAEQRPFLLVRHPTYKTHAFDLVLHWMRANVADLLEDFHAHMLSDALPNRADFRLCIPWLQDPIPDWSPKAYEQALRLSDWCDQHGIPMVNRPSHLTNAGKTLAAALIAQQGIRAPKTALIRDEEEFKETRLSIPLPLFVREDWGHGGPMILAKSEVEVRRIDTKAFRRPAAVEWIDASRDGLFRKYRYLAAGHRGVCHHLQVSAEWITRGRHRIKSAQAREEELAYLRLPDPNHDALQRVRAALDLDMIAIDYGYDQSGAMVVWEANPFPDIPFSRRGLKYRNFAMHESLRAIVMMYYERAEIPVPATLRALREFRPPRIPGQWLRPWRRFRAAIGRTRRRLGRLLGISR